MGWEDIRPFEAKKRKKERYSSYCHLITHRLKLNLDCPFQLYWVRYLGGYRSGWSHSQIMHQLISFIFKICIFMSYLLYIYVWTIMKNCIFPIYVLFVQNFYKNYEKCIWLCLKRGINIISKFPTDWEKMIL